MGFFSNLFRMGSGTKAPEPKTLDVADRRSVAPHSSAAADMVNDLTDKMQDGAGQTNIWDMDTDARAPGGVDLSALGEGAEAGEAAAARARRNKTRMIGFEPAPTQGIGLFEDDAAFDPVPPNTPPATPKDAPAADALPEADPEPEVASAARARRNKTRLIGFETAGGDAIGLFEPDTPPAPAPVALDPTLPVGWVVVTAGAGRGTSATLNTGRSEIGSGAGHAVSLDMPGALTAAAHGAITHDAADNAFRLAPGGPDMTISLNGAVLTEETALSNGDEIGVGEITLRFVALCTDGFDWMSAETVAETGKGEDNGTTP